MSLAVYYGGTFDPVHEGHLAVARTARDALAATVHLVPAADPPHKGPTHADALQRSRMLEIAIAGEPGLRVDRRELHRDGPSYTVDTLTQLRAECGPQTPLVWLVGGDSLDKLHTWHHWRELFALAHIVAVQRPGSHVDAASLAHASPLVHDEVKGRWRGLAELASSPAGALAVLPLRELRPESSSELRRRIAAGEPWRDWVPGPVAGYIERAGLYAAGAA